MNDRVLVRAAARGDRDAVRELARRLMPVLRARVRRAVGATGGQLGSVGADDLVQEIWLALFRDDRRALLAFDPDRGASLEGYVGMLAEREIGNVRQRVGALKRGARLTVAASDELDEVAEAGPTPEQLVSAAQVAEQLGTHLEGALPPRGLLVLRYAFADALPVADVARVMGVSVQVVYNWQHKIREEARRYLSACACCSRPEGGGSDGDGPRPAR